MNRTSTILLVLLVASNAAWLVFRAAPAPPPESPARSTPVAPARIHPPESRQDPAPEIEPPVPSAGESPETSAREERWKTLSGAGALRKTWAEDLGQIDDPGRRERALAEVLSALTESDPARRLAALRVLIKSWDVDYDRTPFVSPVRINLEHDFPEIRGAAALALAAVTKGDDAIREVRALVRDEDSMVRQLMGRVLLRLCGNEPDAAVSGDLTALLSDSNRAVVWQTLDALRQAKGISGALEERLIALASGKDRPLARSARATLGSLPVKSETVVNLLLSYLEKEDYNARLDGYRNLTRGVVPDAMKSRVADAALRVMWNRPEHNDILQCFRILDACGDLSHLAEAERFAASPMLSERLKRTVQMLIGHLRARLDR